MANTELLTDIAQDVGSAGAPYSRITGQIRSQIEAGRLKPGERLPAIREMAKACGVSPFTIGRALNELARDGLVVARSGSGTYVTESVETTVELIISYPAKSWPEAPTDTQYFGQIVKGIRGSSDPAPRCFTSFMDDEHARADEILAVCRARRSKRLIVYRPRGRMEPELAAVAQQMPVVTLMSPLRGVRSGCATTDPSAPFRRVLRERIAAGRRHFHFAVVVTDITDEYSPYAQMYRVFLEVMAEAAIRPVILPLTRFSSEGVRELEGMATSVPDGAVFVASYPTLFDAVRMDRSRVDCISYTERRDTVEKCAGKVTLLYGGIEKCAAAAMALFRTPLGGDAAKTPTTVRVEPEVVPAQE